MPEAIASDVAHAKDVAAACIDLARISKEARFIAHRDGPIAVRRRGRRPSTACAYVIVAAEDAALLGFLFSAITTYFGKSWKSCGKMRLVL